MCILRWTRSHHQDYFLWRKKAPWETKKTFLAHRMSFVARQYSCTASYVPVRRHIYTFDTFTRTVVRLHLCTTSSLNDCSSASHIQCIRCWIWAFCFQSASRTFRENMKVVQSVQLSLGKFLRICFSASVSLFSLDRCRCCRRWPVLKPEISTWLQYLLYALW